MRSRGARPGRGALSAAGSVIGSRSGCGSRRCRAARSSFSTPEPKSSADTGATVSSTSSDGARRARVEGRRAEFAVRVEVRRRGVGSRVPSESELLVGIDGNLTEPFKGGRLWTNVRHAPQETDPCGINKPCIFGQHASNLGLAESTLLAAQRPKEPQMVWREASIDGTHTQTAAATTTATAVRVELAPRINPTKKPLLTTPKRQTHRSEHLQMICSERLKRSSDRVASRTWSRRKSAFTHRNYPGTLREISKSCLSRFRNTAGGSSVQ